jgi:deoxyribodipyrimidine photo-lyase
MVSKIGIHWFRQDLRLDNNPSLISLSKKVNKIVPIYILDLNQRIGSVSKWWLENSLDSLSDSITNQK